jgi:hypothetical protein
MVVAIVLQDKFGVKFYFWEENYLWYVGGNWLKVLSLIKYLCHDDIPEDLEGKDIYLIPLKEGVSIWLVGISLSGSQKHSDGGNISTSVHSGWMKMKMKCETVRRMICRTRQMICQHDGSR